MSFAGLKKQFNKANQYLSETMGAAEATKLDEGFNEMERVRNLHKLRILSLGFLNSSLL